MKDTEERGKQQLSVDHYDLESYKAIIETASGQMLFEEYRDLYEAALSAQKGSVLELGSARGGATVVLGLAAKHNQNIERIVTVDTFRNSRSLRSMENIGENIRELRNNLDRFDCGRRFPL